MISQASMCVSSAKCGAVAGYAAVCWVCVSLVYCSCVFFLLIAVTARVKAVLLRIALEILHLLSFCRCAAYSFVKSLFSPLFQLLLGPVDIFYLKVFTQK